MSIKHHYNPLTVASFHAVDADTMRQTLAESEMEYSIDIGRGITIHHGQREGAPIVVVQHHNQQPDELSAVWYDDGQQ